MPEDTQSMKDEQTFDKFEPCVESQLNACVSHCLPSPGIH
jgi:hypothetical protein